MRKIKIQDGFRECDHVMPSDGSLTINVEEAIRIYAALACARNQLDWETKDYNGRVDFINKILQNNIDAERIIKEYSKNED